MSSYSRAAHRVVHVDLGIEADAPRRRRRSRRRFSVGVLVRLFFRRSLVGSNAPSSITRRRTADAHASPRAPSAPSLAPLVRLMSLSVCRHGAAAFPIFTSAARAHLRGVGVVRPRHPAHRAARRAFATTTRAEAMEYDYDVFTIGAQSRIVVVVPIPRARSIARSRRRRRRRDRPCP